MSNFNIKGVNLGGWLILERWLTQSLYNGVPDNIKDEWGFCQFHGKLVSQQKLKQHWDSWITESDFQRISQLGLNLVRIPVGYWSFIPRHEEPFVFGANEYLAKALVWAKKYNLKVMIDFHGHPGSQNGFDNSGRQGETQWLKQEGSYELSREVVRQLVLQFVKPAKYREVVHSIQVVNEPANWNLNMDTVRSFYSESYRMIQTMVPGLKVVFHNAFIDLVHWKEFAKQFPNAILDRHNYHVFEDYKLRWNYTDHFNQVNRDEAELQQYELPSVVGEFSLATAICLKWEGDKCKVEKGWHEDTPEYNAFAKELMRRQLQAFTRPTNTGFIFWTWKSSGYLEWDYQAAYNKGWIPNLKTMQYVKSNKIPKFNVNTLRADTLLSKKGLNEHSKSPIQLKQITDTFSQIAKMDSKQQGNQFGSEVGDIQIKPLPMVQPFPANLTASSFLQNNSSLIN